MERNIRLLICIDSILPTATSSVIAKETWTPPAEQLQPRRLYSHDGVVTWCNMSTTTFVAITPQNSLPRNSLNNTLTLAKDQITEYVDNLDTSCDSYSASPINKSAGRVALTIVSFDQGLLTWSMSYNAVLELLDWMSSTQTWVGVEFEIWHGVHRVGGGTMQQGIRKVPPGPHR